MRVVDHFIKDESVSGFLEQSDLFNPSTGEKIGSVLHGGADEIDKAVGAAKTAFAEWSKTGLEYRANLMLEIREKLKQNKGELVDVCVIEAGKTKADAAAEVMRAVEGLAYCGSVSSWYSTRLSQNVARGVDTYDARYPIGVVAAISPFNFPILVPVIQAGMAMACGNVVIVKPSEKVPTACRLIAGYCKQAGLPSGVLNIVNGGRAVVESLIEHPDIAGLSFVGSTRVAQKLRTAGVQYNKRVQAFGSGKNHMLVLPDADLDMAADAAISAAYGAAGQRCMAISVVVAIGDIGDELVAKIKQRIPHIKLGSALDDETQLGPLISQESRARIDGFIAEAETHGASLLIDGRQTNTKGFFVGASLVDNVKPGMPIYDDEIFGPVLSIVRTKTFDEAMQVVASHPLGNGAAIFTRDGGVAKQYVDEVQAGAVGVNVPIPVPTTSHSFGGWKGSAFTETKLFGHEAVAFHTQIKSVTTRWPDPADSKIDLGFPATARN